MAKLKDVLAAIKKKKADLDMMDDELSAMPEMAEDAPMDAPTSPEFSLLTDKREELEEEIQKMQEGVQLITEWEKFKGGPWSEEIQKMLDEIDVEITDIAGGEPAPAGDILAGPEAPDMAPDVGPEAPDMAPEGAPVEEVSPPEAAPLPETALAPTEPAPTVPPMAPMASAKSPTNKKNIYQGPDKKANSSPSTLKKEGSNMATQPTSKPSLQEKLAEVKSKREAIKKEAQQRVAAAWTIAKTMLPEAPAEIQKSAAATLLQNTTPVLNAMLRQTAKNAHYSKVAETFKAVHKVELNDLLEDPSVLTGEKSAVSSEIKGDAKAAAVKVADDRKDAGPQPAVFDDGRCYPSKDPTPKEMHADSSASQTESKNRPMDTVNKSEGDKAKKEASKKRADDEGGAEIDDTMGVEAAAKEECKCVGPCKCGAAKKAGEECKCVGPCKCGAKDKKKEAAVAKKADEPPMPPPAEGAEPPMEEDAEPPMEEGVEPPMDMPPAEEAPAEDSAAEVMTDEKKMLVEEKIEEAQEAISALEKEILEESTESEELDYSKIFNEGEAEGEMEGEEMAEGMPEEGMGEELPFPGEEDMEDKAASLANEGEKQADGNGEEYFAPSNAESMEASLDESQFASMEDFFSLRGSDSDPLRALIAGEIHTAADVAGMQVVPSFTGEAAKHFESNTATGENRDMENDHDADLFAEAIESVSPEDGGFKRTKQDDTNVLESPKSAAKKPAAPAIKKLKAVTAAEKKPFDIASALLGNDEF